MVRLNFMLFHRRPFQINVKLDNLLEAKTIFNKYTNKTIENNKNKI